MGNEAAQPERRGFTMIEVVVTVTLTSILMLGLMSAMLIAGKALPDENSPVDHLIRTGQVAEGIAEELRFAVHITEYSSNAITFTVADRDEDGSPETIRYAWSGTTDDPLTRQYNHGTAVTVLDQIHQFNLAYDLYSVTEEYPAPLVESAETELMGYDAASGLGDVHVRDDRWWAEYFKPTFPADAVSWKVTRAQFLARRDTDHDTTMTIGLRLPTAGNMPSDTILDTATMAQRSLTEELQWVEKSFSSAAGLSPEQGLCLTFTTSDEYSGKLRYKTGGVSLPNAGFIEGDPSWKDIKTDKALLFHVYGTVTTQGPPQTLTREYVRGIRLTLQAGDDDSTQLDTAVAMLNAPEVLSAVWEYEGDTDPTTLNMNADGVADWHMRSGGSFDPGAIAAGVLEIPGSANFDLDTVPDNPFTEPTTIEFRYRCTEVANSGVYFWINSDYTGGNFMPVVATLDLRIDMTQDLTISVGGNNVVAMTDLSTDFVTVRILIDPDLDTVNIKVDGADQGSYAYTPYPPTSDPQRATLNHWNSDGEWDYVRIRVGGNNP